MKDGIPMTKAKTRVSTPRRTAPKPKKKKVLPTKKQNDATEAKRAKSYVDMESHLCDIVSRGRIAAQLFDDEDQGLFIFATTHLDDMLREFRARYYAEEFPRV
jgi:hypothetical protein